MVYEKLVFNIASVGLRRCGGGGVGGWWVSDNKLGKPNNI